MKRTLLISTMLLMIPAAAMAQTAQAPTAPVTPATAPAAAPTVAPAPVPEGKSSEQPIEITATKTVEWLRDKKQYVARENVIVTQGGMSIESDLLTADYREGEKSSTEIYQLTAEGNVRIKDATNTAFGDKAVYDVTQGVAVLTGADLKIVSPEQTVTARDRMEYHSNTREAKAIGNAKVVRATDTLTADTISAFFKDDSATAQAVPAVTPAAATADDEEEQKLDVQNPPGPAHDAAIDVTEGTWMSLDVSPDGRQIVFDLMGDIYVMPIGGGEARAIASAGIRDERVKDRVF